ncbi:hypothetical protein C5E06_08525 [Pseudoclavibacter sp. RFBI5]|nr:hypothetical protein C5E06_08525 [Pseudoclavibacter sp. RFBI5]
MPRYSRAFALFLRNSHIPAASNDLDGKIRAVRHETVDASLEQLRHLRRVIDRPDVHFRHVAVEGSQPRGGEQVDPRGPLGNLHR